MSETLQKCARYLDIDVLTAAKQRVKHAIEQFDNVYVSFSGGKDSLVVLHLVREVQRELGIAGPVRCVFRDEELIPDDVISFVDSYRRDSENWAMDYYAVPLRSHKFILGKNYDYVQWDPGRRWIRPKPDFAITSIPGFEGQVFSQYEMDLAAFKDIPGRVAVMTGIRAQESIIRLRACLAKKNENYITATQTPKVSLVKPIYDWLELDVFRYFYDRDIKYCSIYDAQIWNGDALRVSTPLHAEASKRIGKLKTLYPVFYEQLMDVFPEMQVQSRYWSDMKRGSDDLVGAYPHSWSGIIQYINDHVTDPHQKLLALRRVRDCKRFRENREPLYPDNMGGFPLLWVFEHIVNGSYKRNIPACSMSRINRKHYAYEGKTPPPGLFKSLDTITHDVSL